MFLKNNYTLTIRINWKSNTSDKDEQKYREILFAGKQHSLLVNSLLWPKWALVKTELLVAFNEISIRQGSKIVYCTTRMIQVPTLHWRRHKAWDIAFVLKELFNVIEMKKKKNEQWSIREYQTIYSKSSIVTHRQQKLWNFKTWKDFLYLLDLFYKEDKTSFRLYWIVLARHSLKGILGRAEETMKAQK